MTEEEPRKLEVDVILRAKQLVANASMGEYVNDLLKRRKTILIVPDGEYLKWTPEVRAIEHVDMGREKKI